MAIYCGECGSPLQEGEMVCRRCGTPVNAQPAQQYSVPNNQPVMQNYQQPVMQNYQQPAMQNYQQPAMQQMDPAFIGLKSYYFKEFTKIRDSGERYKGKFNICAFLFGWIWALSKGCWLLAILLFVINLLFSFLSTLMDGAEGFFVLLMLAIYVLLGIFGNYIYYYAYVKKKQLPFI